MARKVKPKNRPEHRKAIISAEPTLVRRDQCADAFSTVERNFCRILDVRGIKPAEYGPQGHALYRIEDIALALSTSIDWIRDLLAGRDEALDTHGAARVLGISTKQLNRIFALTREPKPAASWLQYGKIWSRRELEKCEAILDAPEYARHPNKIAQKNAA